MSWRIVEGDCRDTLAGLEAGSVQTVCTSPPYFGLRDYGHGGQIGLEPSPDEFVAALVDVFRGVRRVLRDDGTVWLNLGDSYAGSWGAQSRGETSALADRSVSAQQIVAHPKRTRTGSIPAAADYKAKDLLGIPWMVAFALRADGWYLRSDIIWAKPNPMPESVTDRPTKAHEYVFLLSKGPRYFYDADAIREDVAPSQVGRVRSDPIGGKSWQERQQHSAGSTYTTGLGRGDVRDAIDRDGGRLPGQPLEGALVDARSDESLDVNQSLNGVGVIGRAELDGDANISAEAGERFASHANTIQPVVSNRNRRSVWTVATQPFPGAHFATFPPKLIEPCILAGCPERACSVCGAPWQRVTERTPMVVKPTPKRAEWQATDDHARTQTGGTMLEPPTSRTVGFEPSCGHEAPHVPGTVLDPFAGAGTTGMVALRHNRSFVGLELNPEYVRLARDRIIADSPLLNSHAEVAA